MKGDKRSSIRVKVGKIVTIFSLVTVCFYTTMLAILYQGGLAQTTHDIVWQEAKAFAEAYAEDQNAPLPRADSLKGYIGIDTLPEQVLDVFSKKKIENYRRRHPVMYRYRKNEGSESHYHLLTYTLDDSSKKLYIFYHLTVDDDTASSVWRRYRVFAITGGILVVVLLLLFGRVMQRTIAPLEDLSSWVDKLDEEHTQPPPLPNTFKQDEIGDVAERLYKALRRISKSNEREKQFLRNASHELRTPIAVIRNTLDVIEHKRKINDDSIDEAIARMRRASDTMKSVTEAILWLAVEDYSLHDKQQTDIRKNIEEIIAVNQKIRPNCQLELKVDIKALGECHVEATLLHIALDNLVRNAFNYCREGGELTIRALDGNSIEITNETDYQQDEKTKSPADTAVSFGLGLTLVQRIAKELGWNFEFTLKDGVARSYLSF